MITENYKFELSGAPRQCRTREHVSADESAEERVFEGCAEPLAEEPNLLVHTGGDETQYDSHFDSGFAEGLQLDTFLNRKFYYGTYSWAPSTAFSVTIDPFSWFLNTGDVVTKLDSFRLFKCDFEIEINVKATKFHAGMIQASVRRGGRENTYIDIATQKHLTTFSQRPRILLDISTQQQGILKVPFVYPYSWFALDGVADNHIPNSLWPRVHIVGFGDLAAVGATTGSAEISIFIRAKNVKMAGATTKAFSGVGLEERPTLHRLFKGTSGTKMVKTSKRKPPPNATDEFQAKGPVSQVASVVADVAGRLTDVPFIGKLALASHIGASSIGRIASLFGFSRPALIDDPTRVMPRPSDSFALVDGKAVTDKISLTSKQEVSIDPSIIGLPSIDEMSFSYLKGIESYLTSFTWAPGVSTDTTIFQLLVDPMAEPVLAGTPSHIYPTALSFMSRPFGRWRGSLKYRFVMVASKFHAGKLTISYEPDPSEGGATSDELYQRRQHYVVDLSTDLDVELTVNFQREKNFCDIVSQTSAAPLTYWATTGVSIGASQYRTNGTIFVQPYTELTVTDDVTPVKVLVFISAGDDYEVQEPFIENWEQLTYKPTSRLEVPTLSKRLFEGCAEASSTDLGELSTANQMDTRAATKVTLTKEVSEVAPGDSPIFFGEKPTSFRQMIKRWCPYLSAYHKANSYWTMKFRDFPLYRGRDPDAINTDSTGTIPYNYVCNTYLNYLAPAYGFWRGGIRYRIRPLEGVDCEQVISKYNDPSLMQGPTASSWNTVGTNKWAASAVPEMQYEIEGAAISRRAVNDMLDVEIPFYSPMRANVVGLFDTNYNQSDGYCYGNTFYYDTYDDTQHPIKVSVCAGDDFAFMCFNGAPVTYTQASPAA